MKLLAYAILSCVAPSIFLLECGTNSENHPATLAAPHIEAQLHHL
jgi:hypothetical protein